MTNKLVLDTDTSTLDARLTRLEQIVVNLVNRFACTCGASAQSTWLGIGANPENQLTPTHQPFCPLYVRPATRYRDCWNCGNTGVIEPEPGVVITCSVCGGTAKVPEVWVDGHLVNELPSTV